MTTCQNCGALYGPETLGNGLSERGCPNCGYNPRAIVAYLKSIDFALNKIAHTFNEYLNTRKAKDSKPPETPTDG